VRDARRIRHPFFGCRRQQSHVSTTIEMGARQYAAILGRFLSTDPVPGGNSNAYNYPNNPVDSNDLTGMYMIGPTCFGAGDEYASALSRPQLMRIVQRTNGLHVEMAAAVREEAPLRRRAIADENDVSDPVAHVYTWLKLLSSENADEDAEDWADGTEDIFGAAGVPGLVSVVALRHFYLKWVMGDLPPEEQEDPELPGVPVDLPVELPPLIP
jgi:RHS repeat-associated protein